MPGVSSPWPSNPDIEALVNRANGSFLSAVKIVEDIRDPRDTPDRNLIAALGDSAGPGPSPNYTWKKRHSHSCSPHTSAGQSPHTYSHSSPVSSASPIQSKFVTAAVSGSGSSSWVSSSARTAESLRMNTSSSSIRPHTHERTVSHESLLIPQTANNRIEPSRVDDLTLDDFLEQLILRSGGSMSFEFCYLSYNHAL